MKLSRKLVMVSVAALMGVSPVLATSVNNASVVEAARKSPVYRTKGTSRVTVKRTMNFVDRNGKKTRMKAYKNGHYKIFLVTRINGKLYYAIESAGKHWVPASDTRGKVTYATRKKTVKKAVKKTNKRVTKKVVKKPVRKATKKVVKKVENKNNSKKAAKKTTPTRLVTIRRTSVYDKNGKKAKTYMGSKRWTTIAKNVKLLTRGSKTIDGTEYYALDEVHFVKAADVKAR